MGGSVSCHVVLVHYGAVAGRGPHPSASQPPSPSGKAFFVIDQRDVVASLHSVGRAFPWGEGGPASAGSDEGNVVKVSRSV